MTPSWYPLGHIVIEYPSTSFNYNAEMRHSDAVIIEHIDSNIMLAKARIIYTDSLTTYPYDVDVYTEAKVNNCQLGAHTVQIDAQLIRT